MSVRRYYICDNCDYHFDISQDFNDKTLKKCPSCKKHKLYQDLAGIYVSCVGEPKTVGQLAERNAKKMGKYELESRLQKDGIDVKEIEAKRDKKERINKINKMNAKQKQDYIMKGDI